MSARVSACVCVCWTRASLSTSWQVELIKNLAIPLVSLDLDKLQSCESGRASVRERREQWGRDSGSLKLNRCTYKLSRIRHVVRLRLTMCVSVTIYACVCVCVWEYFIKCLVQLTFQVAEIEAHCWETSTSSHTHKHTLERTVGQTVCVLLKTSIYWIHYFTRKPSALPHNSFTSCLAAVTNCRNASILVCETCAKLSNWQPAHTYIACI